MHSVNYNKLYEIGSIMVLASRLSWLLLDTQTLKIHPSGHPNLFMRNFSKCHLHIIPMTLDKDIMPYFNKFIHING